MGIAAMCRCQTSDPEGYRQTQGGQDGLTIAEKGTIVKES